jgi:hypothetical protein
MKCKLFVIAFILFSQAGVGAAQVRHSRRTSNPVGPASINAGAQAALQTLPIRRITLYSNGVAYIERRGAVTGHPEINLSFKQSPRPSLTARAARTIAFASCSNRTRGTN